MVDGLLTSCNLGGSTITENVNLLLILTNCMHSTMENNNIDSDPTGGELEKIYVDSPAYDDDDEDKYKYVSTNVDDFDESQLKALMMEKPHNSDLVPDTAQQSTRLSSGQYHGNLSGGRSRSPSSHQLPHHFKAANLEDEDKELRAEQEYQAGLQSRLAKQSQEVRQLGIPRLDLSDDDDNQHDSVDPVLGGVGKLHEISIRDSLDADELQQAKDQEHLKLLMEGVDPQGFKVLMKDNLEDKLSNDNIQQNPFRLDLNELERSPESTQGDNEVQSGMAPPHGDDLRLQQMFQQNPQQQLTPGSQRPGLYQQAPYYEALPAPQQLPQPSQHQSLAVNYPATTTPGNYQSPLTAPLPANDYVGEEYGPPHDQHFQDLRPYPNGPEQVETSVYTNTVAHWSPKVDPNSPNTIYYNPESIDTPKHYQAQNQVRYDEKAYYNQQEQLYKKGPSAPMHGYYGSNPIPLRYQHQQAHHYQEPQTPKYHEQQPHQYKKPEVQEYHQQQFQQYQNQQQYQYDLHPQQYHGPYQYYDSNKQQQFLSVLPQNDPQTHLPLPVGSTLPQNDEQSSSPTSLEVPQKDKSKIDFLARNKKDYSKTAASSKNSYSKAYSQRKQAKENLPPAPAQGKKRGGPVRAKHPEQLQKDNSSGTFIVADGEKPGTAETLWSKRTQTLANSRKGTGLESGGLKKGKHEGTLQKYPSESRVDQLKKAGSAPAKLNPIKGSSRQAFTEPLRSEVEVDPSRVGNGDTSFRHTVFTDDGQKVSVDINLKLMSPGPYGQSALYHPPVYPLQHHPHMTQHPQMQPVMHNSQIGPVSQYQQGPPPPGLQDHRQFGGQYYQPALALHQQQYHLQQDPDDCEQLAHQQAYAVVDRGTPLSQRSGKPPSPISSPFKVLPPIGSADSSSSKCDTSRNEGNHPDSGYKAKKIYRAPPKAQPDFYPPKDNSSYLEQMRHAKERKQVEYKQYTVKDYKNLKRDVRLGGLGPDLDSNEVKERREKRERQVEYAKNISSKNKRVLENAPKVSARRPDSENEDLQGDLLHRRRVALEYAKNVPKPKIKPPTEKRNSTVVEPMPVSKVSLTANRRVSANITSPVKPFHDEHQLLDLETLQKRHEEEKEKAALIRQQIHAGNV